MHCFWHRCYTVKVSKVCLGLLDSLGAIRRPSARQPVLSFRQRKGCLFLSVALRGARKNREESEKKREHSAAKKSLITTA